MFSFGCMKYEKSYVLTIQFLGFRFHGWQKQQHEKTVHEMIDKTLGFVFKHSNFKTIGVGRTDSKVSANTYMLQLFVDESIETTPFLDSFNKNLPNDIKGVTIQEVAASFNVIQAKKEKEYIYIFSHGEKNHPFAASLIVGLDDHVDIELMKQGARLFEGEHYFHKYCTQPSEYTLFKRTISRCYIEENTIYEANFFPKKSYAFRVTGAGFLRYQIRLMMGVLFELGRHRISLEFIEASLRIDNDRAPLKTIAPSSGLQLYSIKLLQ